MKLKNLYRKVIMLLIIVGMVQYFPNVTHAQEQDISQDDMESTLDVICSGELHDGEQKVVNGKYIVSCEEIIIEKPNYTRNAYSVTKSASQTFHVADGTREIFTISQTVTAIFNTYTEKVKIASHSATFTAIDSSYKLASSRQGATINIWNEMVAGRIEMLITQGTSSGMLYASTTVTYSQNPSGNNFKFSFSQVW